MSRSGESPDQNLASVLARLAFFFGFFSGRRLPTLNPSDLVFVQEKTTGRWGASTTSTATPGTACW